MLTANLKLEKWRVESPSGNIVFNVSFNENGKLEYYITKGGDTIIENSPLGIKTNAADFTEGLTFDSYCEKTISESYILFTGKKSTHKYQANEISIKFKKKLHIISVNIRVFDDGAAFCYTIPGEGQISIYSEDSSFKLPADTYGWAQNFVCWYEGFYNKKSYEELLNADYGMPLLLGMKDNYVLISEAGVYGNYCASHLGGCAEKGMLTIKFAPDQGISVMDKKPLITPWRAVVIGSLADIAETEMFENLNPECELADTSWIKAGRAAWSWWSGDGTKKYDIQVKYIDFAHRMGWEYYLCDAGWQKSWISQLVEYAASKNVGLFVWYHYKDLETDDELLTELPWLASLGVKGVKVDFFESDSQERLKTYDRIAEVAKRYKLMLVYHGCTKPSGDRRRWPHIMSREGILGAEYYLAGPIPTGATAEHNCTVPFTRNAVGSMDYTPVTYSENKNQTTWAHQTALAVVFESGVQHYADRPESYESVGAAVDFLKACPAAWDDTKLIDGEPGRYVVIARRSGDDWFLGALCGGGISKSMTVVLDFLDKDSTYTADIYSDGDIPEDIIHSSEEVTSYTALNIIMQVNGGCSVSLKRQI